MTVELDGIIATAMAGLDEGSGSDGGIDTGDTGSTDTGDTPDVPAEGAADAGAEATDDTGQEADASGRTPEPDAADARSADDIAFDAELAELGLAAPKPGQRDNRIPYSRIRKIVANAKTKWSEKLKGEHTVALTAHETKIKDYETRAKEFDAAEHLIQTDPERYVSLLAQIYPQQYKQFVKGAAAADQPKTNPEPQPDVKYEDGSLGYSPEQFAKLREYDRKESARQAKEDSTKEFNERFGPIEQAYKETKKGHEDIQRVRGDIGKLREQWGDDLIDNQDVQKAIVAHMDANPKATLVEATRTVVRGRIQADRTAMRAEILAELKGAPKAAAKAPAAPNKSDATAGSESYEDIISKAMKSIR